MIADPKNFADDTHLSLTGYANLTNLVYPVVRDRLLMGAAEDNSAVAFSQIPA
jgi:hypothetical protein